MDKKSEHAELYANFSQTVSFVQGLLPEFEKAFDEKVIRECLPNAKTVYMQVIVINIAQLVNATKQDKFGICQLKEIASKEIREKIEVIEKSHRDITGKVSSNRNRLFAHTDKNYYKLCISDKRKDEMKGDMVGGRIASKEEAERIFSKMPKAIGKNEERYSPIDLKNDLPRIKKLLEEFDIIWHEVLCEDEAFKV
ncbi:MAG: hypothetical protein COV91_03815 [Candidatus Taylorbacteria bacterium CG11_big_fil_rev_8_21_14_0_20_46_11]|uniref:HEPN AbiU2-like domain-containing protein n=1 Tax=Candidatus Taylorbacteria bacterium CG11_big_fil_rev_8_21_14_0_20_46_11 TaxID=1975025 RepID=A0A2H0KB51_9BACT|nr:MAG: hypothetical protein COV91_03815 [Candidatus Taylorbacteria bacterium CG11_big_fil_rev_8_21_14_0_20_46_11]